MGSSIIQNDTLQITKEQGFPKELDFEAHKKNPLRAEDFSDKIFSFSGKLGIRNYQAPPVRNFLVENRDGKWLYWGLVHILSVAHDYVRNTTSGTFKLLYLYTLEEMRMAHKLTDRNRETEFFNG